MTGVFAQLHERLSSIVSKVVQAGGHVHADFVMGVPGGIPGTAGALVAGVSMLPAGATWSATGIGMAWPSDCG